MAHSYLFSFNCWLKIISTRLITSLKKELNDKYYATFTTICKLECNNFNELIHYTWLHTQYIIIYAYTRYL